MTRKQKNRLAMFIMMRLTCEEQMKTLGRLPNFREYYNELVKILDKIEKLATDQEKKSMGATKTKLHQKEMVIGQTMEILRRVKAYAEVNELPELKGNVNYAESKLRKKPGIVLQAICQIIHTECSNYSEPLAEYGVTQRMLDEQQASNDTFFEMMVLPRFAIIQRKGATTAMDREFKKVTRVLHKMDRLADMLETTNNDVFTNYRNSRRVINRRRGRRVKTDARSLAGGRIVKMPVRKEKEDAGSRMGLAKAGMRG